MRKNEKHKRDMLFSVCFGSRPDISQSEKEELDFTYEYYIGAFTDDNETLMAQVAVVPYKSYYHGNILTAAGIAGVSTLPEYRRNGCIREIFKHIFDGENRNEWDTSFLYPFSYRYYRKFGFERLLQHKTVCVPLSSLSHIPRNDKGVLYTCEDRLGQLLELYNSFASSYNVCFHRENGRYYSSTPFKTGLYTYIWYEDNKPRAYATIKPEGNKLNISELVYVDKASLLGIIGFLRMYEGQYTELYFSSLDKNNPLDLVTDSDRSSSFGMYDGVMGRPVNIEKCLMLYPFSKDADELVIEVTGDFIEANNGCYYIEYKDEKSKRVVVTRREKAKPDITLSVNSLSRLMFGDCAQESLAYLPDVTLHSQKCRLDSIFTPRAINLFERF
jgi:predicted acetyltransferase